MRELAAAHRLERMRRLGMMLEEQEAWKREAGFDRIQIIAQMDAQRFRAGFDSEPLYSKLYNPRWPHTPEVHTLDMRADVERLRMKIVLSQPAPPPQCGSSPRRSPAVGTGLDEPGVPRVETQSTEREGTFPLQASLDGCTNLDQEDTAIWLQAHVGVDDAETTTTKDQVASREEFARPPKKRQQRRVTAWGADQTKELDPGG